MKPISTHRLITNEQMRLSDRQAEETGVPVDQLIENAGACIAEEIGKRYQPGKIVVLAGPGNNGQDGLAAAKRLAVAGWEVELWEYFEHRDPPEFDGVDLILDALFGAGLSRPLGDDVQALIRHVFQTRIPVVSVDIPSGIDGDTGWGKPIGFQAELTVTFFRKKPGHLLYPGLENCGEVVCCDIGIKDEVAEGLGKPIIYENHPDLWKHAYPCRIAQAHKYKYGHVVCISGYLPKSGAIRLSAKAALRIGAGLVTIASPNDALVPHAANADELMLARCNSRLELSGILGDPRKNAIVIGPGLGLGSHARDMLAEAFSARAPVVVDADAITFHMERADLLFRTIRHHKPPTIMTPHEGEFVRLFPDVHGSKLERAKIAAKRSGAIIVFKGPDTVIATPDDEYVINTNASPFLATAGTGDVLAGMIGGLLAQGLPAFDAACAAVWLHGKAGDRPGPGLVAGDLIDNLPGLLADTFYT